MKKTRRIEPHSYKGFETFRNALVMSLQMQKYLFLFSLFAVVLVTLGVEYFRHKYEYGVFLQYLGHCIRTHSAHTLNNLFEVFVLLALQGVVTFIFALIFFGFPFYVGAQYYFYRRSVKQHADFYVRGSRFIEASQLQKFLSKVPCNIPLGELSMPVDAETKHVFVVGQTGSGKTQLLKRAFSKVQDMSKKAIVYDFKGDYLPSNFNPETDLIFNPLDSRSLHWTIFNDVSSTLDIDQVICHGMIRGGEYGQDPFWSHAALLVFRGILYSLYRENEGHVTNSDIWNVVTSGAGRVASRLREIPEGAAGFEMIIDMHSKQTQGIMAKLLQHTSSLEIMSSQEGAFSIRKWLSDGKPGTLYVVGNSKTKDLLKPILTLLIDMAAHEVLSMQDDRDRRMYFFLDEFGSLNPMSSIIELLTRARSKGVSVWIGTQEIGQIEKLYGKDLRAAIVNNCATKCMLSIGEPDTAKYLSDMIGETEVNEAQETLSMGISDFRDGLSYMTQSKVKKLLLPSELQTLPHMRGIVKLPDYDFSRISVPLVIYENKYEMFLQREDLDLERMIQKYSEINDTVIPDPQEGEGIKLYSMPLHDKAEHFSKLNPGQEVG